MMAHSEEGTFPKVIFDYCIYDENSQLVSFSKLPLEWNEVESSNRGSNARHIYMCGHVIDEMNRRTQYLLELKAWRFTVKENPEIFVLLELEDGLPLKKEEHDHWVKLENPSKTYESVCRPLIISVHCLWYFRSNPEASFDDFMDHTWIVFSSYDVMPSLDDLINNVAFITEATNRDKELKKSKVVTLFLKNPKMIKCFDEEKNKNLALPNLMRQLQRNQQLLVRQHGQVARQLIDVQRKNQSELYREVLGKVDQLLVEQNYAVKVRMHQENKLYQQQKELLDVWSTYVQDLKTDLKKQEKERHYVKKLEKERHRVKKQEKERHRVERQKENKHQDTSFRVQFQERMNLILNPSATLFAGLVGALVTTSLQAEHAKELKASVALMVFSTLGFHGLLTFYDHAVSDPRGNTLLRVIRSLCYDAAFAAPYLLFIAVFAQKDELWFYRVFLLLVCLGCFVISWYIKH